ncbi:fibroblast growth factor binding protein 2a [Nothobranchius furzeri]|nr:fibroblast growth factor binding protein 2a [Nothobranchius furzeri]KAF7228637.1 fibroblast growth factor binding protein 2 [Nothobranchius furzeri]
MWIQASTLLLACLLWPAEAQDEGGRRQSIWDNPIKFKTKAMDKCTMIITGQGEDTNLRVSCQGTRRPYWCDYAGRPHTCSAYNKNPLHYFVQMMWTLRKLQNACQGAQRFKPHMCRKASDDSQMVLTAISYGSQPVASRNGPRSSKQSARVQTPPAFRSGFVRKAMKANRATERVKTSPQTTTPPPESTPKRMARQHCWRSLNSICSFVIGLFRN